MLTGGSIRVAVGLAVAIVPWAPLYCPRADAAAMACCATQANTCNQPTAPDDDCCRDAPTDGQTLSASGAFRVEPGAAPALEAIPQGRTAASVASWTPHGLSRPDLDSPAPRPPLILRI